MRCDICGRRHLLGAPPLRECLNRVKIQAIKDEARVRTAEAGPKAYTSALLDLHARRMRNG